MKLTIQANRRAVEFLAGKAATMPSTLERLLPDLRNRAFAVGRVTDYDVLRDMLAELAKLPAGSDWRETRKTIAAQISPYMDNSPEGQAAAKRKAEFIVQTNGSQAYAVARYEQQRDTADALPWWQYNSVGDGHVRDAHAALDGKVFRADDPFWETHYPPWDYGCRCFVSALTDAEAGRMRAADAEKQPEARRVLEGKALVDARGGSINVRDANGIVTTVDLRPPAEKALSGKEARAAYRFRPGDLHPDLDQLRLSYEGFPGVFAAFAAAMRRAEAAIAKGAPRRKVWDWLFDDLRAKDRRELAASSKNERAFVRDWSTGERIAEVVGDANSVNLTKQIAAARKAGQTLVVAHSHTSGDWMASPRDVFAAIANRDVVREVAAIGGLGYGVLQPAYGSRYDARAANELKARLARDFPGTLKRLLANGVLRYSEDALEML